MTSIDITHEQLGAAIGQGHGKTLYMGVPSKRDDNHSITPFGLTNQGLGKTVKVSIEPSATDGLQVADDIYLKFNYYNSHATSSIAVADFWGLISEMEIRENNEIVLQTTTDSVDDIYKCSLVGVPYDKQRFTNYCTNNADDFAEYETLAAATESSVKHYVSLNQVTNNYFKNYVMNNVRRLSIQLKTMPLATADTSAAFHWINLTADADISANLFIYNLELCVKAKQFAPEHVPMFGCKTKHIMYGYEKVAFTIDADPVTGSTGFKTIKIKDNFTDKKFVDRIYFYSDPALSAFNTTTGMVKAHKYIDNIQVKKGSKDWFKLASYPEKLIHMAEALERNAEDPTMFNAVAHYTALPYSFVDFTTTGKEPHHKAHLEVLDGISPKAHDLSLVLGNNITTSAHVTLQVIMRYKRVITKAPGSCNFIQVDE